MTSPTITLEAWRQNGGPRPSRRPDGIPTRIDRQWFTEAESAIAQAMYAVEGAGGSVALTHAVTLLAKALARVADHVEGVDPPGVQPSMSGADRESVETNPAYRALRDNQRQLDMDGCEVGVSRQALDEILDAFAALAPPDIVPPSPLKVIADEMRAGTARFVGPEGGS